MQPRYPVYIPSAFRATEYQSLTARELRRDDVPFHLVVRPDEADAYAELFGAECLLVLPDEHVGTLIQARNWIKDHATAAGYERHWQLDDNMRHFYRRYKGKRIPCHPGVALAVCEDFSDRYENVAISGLAYSMFVPDFKRTLPFYYNVHVYSCTLVLNAIPHRWRLIYNDDTDICLQVLADGWCTLLLNAFCVHKMQTMKVAGGNTNQLYEGDGRLKMARMLERQWPGVVRTERRFQRPQHVVKEDWRYFDTPLKLKPGLSLEQLAQQSYDLELKELKPLESADLKILLGLGEHRE